MSYSVIIHVLVFNHKRTRKGKRTGGGGVNLFVVVLYFSLPAQNRPQREIEEKSIRKYVMRRSTTSLIGSLWFCLITRNSTRPGAGFLEARN